METKTLRLEDSLYKKLMDIYHKDENFETQQSVYTHLLYLGLQEYEKGSVIETDTDSEHIQKEYVDDRLTLESLHMHLRNAVTGNDAGLYDIAPVSVLRIYQKEKDRLDMDINMDDLGKSMEINLLIDRFYGRYAYLKHIFYEYQLNSFHYETLCRKDERYHFIYILDLTQHIPLYIEQEERIKHLFSIYKTLYKEDFYAE